MSFAKDSYWLKSGLYTLLQRFAALIFGFGGFMMLIRMLPKEEFGTLALFTTVTALVEVARNGLIQNAQIKFAAAAKDGELPIILNSSFTLNILVTLFSIGLLLGGAYPLSKLWNSPVIERMFYLYTATTFVLIFLSQFNFIQQAKLDFRGIFYSTLVRQGSFFLVICFYFITQSKLGLEALVLFQTLGAVLGAITGYQFVKSYYRPKVLFHWEWIRKLFHYGKYVFGTNISAMLFSSVDQMILGAMLSSAQVAVYNAATRLNNFVDIPVSSVASIVFPKSAQRVEESGASAVVYLYERSVGLLLAILLPFILCVIFLAKPIIIIIAGTQYLSAVPVLQLLMAVNVFQPFLRQFGTALDSIGKPKINFYILILISLLNAATNYIFIIRYGTFGAAMGTAVALAIFFISSQSILKKQLGTKVHHTFIFMADFYVKGWRAVIQKLKKK